MNTGSVTYVFYVLNAKNYKFLLICSNCCRSEPFYFGYVLGNKQNWISRSHPKVSQKNSFSVLWTICHIVGKLVD